MGRFLFGLIFVVMLAFTAVTLYYRFTTGSFTAGGAEMDQLFGAGKDRILEITKDIANGPDDSGGE